MLLRISLISFGFCPTVRDESSGFSLSTTFRYLLCDFQMKHVSLHAKQKSDNDMKKEDLIKQCRYYHGESECPFPYNAYSDNYLSCFWNLERTFVNNRVSDEMRDTYERIGGKKYKGIPYDLLITMFTSWGKFAYDLKASLNNFYKFVDEYLSVANDHFPEDKIPNQ